MINKISSIFRWEKAAFLFCIRSGSTYYMLFYHDTESLFVFRDVIWGNFSLVRKVVSLCCKARSREGINMEGEEKLFSFQRHPHNSAITANRRSRIHFGSRTTTINKRGMTEHEHFYVHMTSLWKLIEKKFSWKFHRHELEGRENGKMPAYNSWLIYEDLVNFRVVGIVIYDEACGAFNEKWRNVTC